MITVVHNSELSPAGHLIPVFERAKVVVDHVRAHLGERLPSKPQAVVVLGGEMGAYDEGRHPFLADEKQWIGAAVEAGTPVLGICLGAQLMADALGGKAMRADHPEADLIDFELTPEGKADPVLGGIEPPVVSIHGDTFELPSEAVLLARSDRFPLAFRLGSGLGVQFHPEVLTTTVSSWARSDLRSLIAAAGTDPDALVHRVVAAESHLRRQAEGLFERWLRQIAPR